MVPFLRISLFLLALVLTYIANAQKVLTLQPGAKEGKDAFFQKLFPDRNWGAHPDYAAMAWTIDGPATQVRSLLQFDLSSLPANAKITEATLSLYHSTDPSNPQHSTLSGSNEAIIQRAISSWEENTVTWNTQPKTTPQNQVLLPASDQADQDYLSIKVTALVQDMVKNPAASFGFMIRLQTESHYRALMFASSDNPDAKLHPKLTIKYRLPAASPPLVQESAAPPKKGVTKPTTKQTVKIVHDTVYVNRTRLDTVYVDRLRVDTVYMNRVENKVDQSSMEGFAYNNLVLLLDVSASMNSPHKLPLLKESVKRLLKVLRAEDEVSIVIYSGKASVLLPPTSAKEGKKINQVIDRLESSGSTDGSAGMHLAYKVADKNYIRGGNNRIVLATDGEFSVGSALLNLVEQHSRQEIYLSVFDFSGHAKTTASALQRLAEKGRGNFQQIVPTNSDANMLQEAQAKPWK